MRIPFFSTRYRPAFVEGAAMALGGLGLVVVGAARLAGAA